MEDISDAETSSLDAGDNQAEALIEPQASFESRESSLIPESVDANNSPRHHEQIAYFAQNYMLLPESTQSGLCPLYEPISPPNTLLPPESSQPDAVQPPLEMVQSSVSPQTEFGQYPQFCLPGIAQASVYPQTQSMQLRESSSSVSRQLSLLSMMECTPVPSQPKMSLGSKFIESAHSAQHPIYENVSSESSPLTMNFPNSSGKKSVQHSMFSSSKTAKLSSMLKALESSSIPSQPSTSFANRSLRDAIPASSYTETKVNFKSGYEGDQLIDRHYSIFNEQSLDSMTFSSSFSLHNIYEDISPTETMEPPVSSLSETVQHPVCSAAETAEHPVNSAPETVDMQPALSSMFISLEYSPLIISSKQKQKELEERQPPSSSNVGLSTNCSSEVASDMPVTESFTWFQDAKLFDIGPSAPISANTEPFLQKNYIPPTDPSPLIEISEIDLARYLRIVPPSQESVPSTGYMFRSQFVSPESMTAQIDYAASNQLNPQSKEHDPGSKPLDCNCIDCRSHRLKSTSTIVKDPVNVLPLLATSHSKEQSVGHTKEDQKKAFQCLSHAIASKGGEGKKRLAIFRTEGDIGSPLSCTSDSNDFLLSEAKYYETVSPEETVFSPEPSPPDIVHFAEPLPNIVHSPELSPPNIVHSLESLSETVHPPESPLEIVPSCEFLPDSVHSPKSPPESVQSPKSPPESVLSPKSPTESVQFPKSPPESMHSSECSPPIIVPSLELLPEITHSPESSTSETMQPLILRQTKLEQPFLSSLPETMHYPAFKSTETSQYSVFQSVETMLEPEFSQAKSLQQFLSSSPKDVEPSLLELKDVKSTSIPSQPKLPLENESAKEISLYSELERENSGSECSDKRNLIIEESDSVPTDDDDSDQNIYSTLQNKSPKMDKNDNSILFVQNTCSANLGSRQPMDQNENLPIVQNVLTDTEAMSLAIDKNDMQNTNTATKAVRHTTNLNDNIKIVHDTYTKTEAMSQAIVKNDMQNEQDTYYAKTDAASQTVDPNDNVTLIQNTCTSADVASQTTNQDGNVSAVETNDSLSLDGFMHIEKLISTSCNVVFVPTNISQFITEKADVSSDASIIETISEDDMSIDEPVPIPQNEAILAANCYEPISKDETHDMSNLCSGIETECRDEPIPSSSSDSGSMYRELSSVEKVYPKSVLFLCEDNITKSPLAAAVFIMGLNERGLEANWCVESAGLCPDVYDEPMDLRALYVLNGNNIVPGQSASRKVQPFDFKKFNFIFCLTEKDLKLAKKIAPPEHRSKIDLFHKNPFKTHILAWREWRKTKRRTRNLQILFRNKEKELHGIKELFNYCDYCTVQLLDFNLDQKIPECTCAWMCHW